MAQEYGGNRRLSVFCSMFFFFLFFFPWEEEEWLKSMEAAAGYHFFGHYYAYEMLLFHNLYLYRFFVSASDYVSLLLLGCK